MTVKLTEGLVNGPDPKSVRQFNGSLNVDASFVLQPHTGLKLTLRIGIHWILFFILNGNIQTYKYNLIGFNQPYCRQMLIISMFGAFADSICFTHSNSLPKTQSIDINFITKT